MPTVPSDLGFSSRHFMGFHFENNQRLKGVKPVDSREVSPSFQFLFYKTFSTRDGLRSIYNLPNLEVIVQIKHHNQDFRIRNRGIRDIVFEESNSSITQLMLQNPKHLTSAKAQVHGQGQEINQQKIRYADSCR